MKNQIVLKTKFNLCIYWAITNLFESQKTKQNYKESVIPLKYKEKENKIIGVTYTLLCQIMVLFKTILSRYEQISFFHSLSFSFVTS